MANRYTPPRRLLAVVPELEDDADELTKERDARRRLVTLTGRCPCGAELHVPDHIEPGTVLIVEVEHEPGCPAAEDRP
jgi:hypothetical protein